MVFRLHLVSPGQPEPPFPSGTALPHDYDRPVFISRSSFSLLRRLGFMDTFHNGAILEMAENGPLRTLVTAVDPQSY